VQIHAFPALKRWAFLWRARGAGESRFNGRRAITGDTALRLAHFFGTSPEFWLTLQSLYEIRLAERKSGKSIKTLPTLKRAHLARA
jgi:plasmid maintenance system antidote protein VapI